MNTNELITKFPAPVREANYHFNDKYYLTRSLLFAAGCALGVLAVKGYTNWREHREAQLDNEIEQFLVDNPPQGGKTERDAA